MVMGLGLVVGPNRFGGVLGRRSGNGGESEDPAGPVRERDRIMLDLDREPPPDPPAFHGQVTHLLGPAILERGNS